MDAVPALVGALVELAFLVNRSKISARCASGAPQWCARSRCRSISSVFHASVKAGAMESHHACGVMPFFFARLGNLLAVLVGAGDERHVVAVHALIARHGVGGDRGVRRYPGCGAAFT